MTITRVCNDCGQEKSLEDLVKNGKCLHGVRIIPIAAGGVHDVQNLQLLAAPLNINKGAKTDWQLPWKDYPA